MTRLARPDGSRPTPRSVDVAQLAGVSQKTVSRVLNDEPYVSADVRRRVLDAAEELGYRRNQAARALASGRTRSIGVVTLGSALYGPASWLVGIERAVREVGYTLRMAATIEGDPGGITGALASLVFGAPTTFAAPQVVTARVGADEPPVVEGDWSAASGYAAGRELAGDDTVTAVFAANDDMAIGLIRAQLEAGRRVPEDISIPRRTPVRWAC